MDLVGEDFDMFGSLGQIRIIPGNFVGVLIHTGQHAHGDAYLGGFAGVDQTWMSLDDDTDFELGRFLSLGGMIASRRGLGLGLLDGE